MFIYEFCFFSFDKRMNHRISDSASFLKISRTQASIYYKFLLVLSDPLEKCVYSICFACGPKSVLMSISRIQSSLMYYCLPEPNVTRVIKITERSKMLWPITVQYSENTAYWNGKFEKWSTTNICWKIRFAAVSICICWLCTMTVHMLTVQICFTN